MYFKIEQPYLHHVELVVFSFALEHPFPAYMKVPRDQCRSVNMNERNYPVECPGSEQAERQFLSLISILDCKYVFLSLPAVCRDSFLSSGQPNGTSLNVAFAHSCWFLLSGICLDDCLHTLTAIKCAPIPPKHIICSLPPPGIGLRGERLLSAQSVHAGLGQ